MTPTAAIWTTTAERFEVEYLTNNHHVFSERRWYKSPLERKLRQHKGFVIPMEVLAHSELHANLPPPEKPNFQQSQQLLQDIGEFQLGRGRLYCVYYAIEFFNVMSNSSSEAMAQNALEIAGNLESQVSYMTFHEPEAVRRIA
jgi:hypothetical protein